MKLRIEEILRERGKRNVDLAKGLGYTAAAVSRIVTGKTTPTLGTLEKMADILNVPVWHFFVDPATLGSGLSDDVVVIHDAPSDDDIVIPPLVAKIPAFDILGHMMKQKGIASFGGLFYHYIEDDSLEPQFMKGDCLALMAYPKGGEIVVQGSLCAVDTYSNGLLVRFVFSTEEGYILRSADRVRYPDTFIPKEDVIRIYRRILMVRY